ncbi:GAF domain-containing protein [Chryseolinea sp. H1M3-3]|uniref:GAF domain-containing protein n=1 Tax=Chryseolinea sp. H1M3-3 TaxID=3034144 RepID=UPI0023EDA8FC|nr:GAF domain-containing protein [Chryseolinea sp. H1M3-3]
MRFLKKQALLIFTSVFAVLLIVHTAFVFIYIMQQKELAAPLQDAAKVSGSIMPETNALNIITILQVLLVSFALPVLYLFFTNIKRNRERLSNVMSDLDQSNRTYIFNSLEQLSNQNEEEVKAKVIANLKQAREFIKAISSGNYAITWNGMTDKNKEANQETIAGALLHMRDQMQRVKEEDQIRIWTTEGLSKFGEIIRKYQDNFDKLSENLISNVVNYVGAKVGGLFILEEDEKSNSKYLQLRASYAYDRKKYISKTVEIGEGIVGQCYLEAQTVYLAKVPNNYLSITSGLGGANPNSLLVIPLRTNDKIEGVLELASLKPFKPHEIEFLEKLGELLASSIITVRTAEKTNHLLQISQEQAEEMRAQEEEMRQNMEELEATQEQMNRTVSELATLKGNLEKEKYLLDSLMDNIPDAIYFKDRTSKFIRVSKYLASHFSGNVEDLIGKSDFDFQDRSRAQQAYDDEMKIMATRKPKIDYIEKEIMTDGSEHWVSTTKMPLINGKGEVVGTFGISRDVTRLKKLENEVISKDKSLSAEKKQYEDKIKLLENQLKGNGIADD